MFYESFLPGHCACHQHKECSTRTWGRKRSNDRDQEAFIPVYWSLVGWLVPLTFSTEVVGWFSGQNRYAFLLVTGPLRCDSIQSYGICARLAQLQCLP